MDADDRMPGSGMIFAFERHRPMKAGYAKTVIEASASKTAAQSFYRGLGFAECGRLTRQVLIDGQMDDEIILETFL